MNYNLKQLEEKTIRQCIFDNPDSVIEDIAEMLGVTERTVYRKIKEYGIKIKSSHMSIRKAKELLEKQGYTIDKK